MKNICYEILTHLSKNGNRPVFDDGVNSVSSTAFKNLIESFILRMEKVGIWSGSCVGIYAEDIIISSALSLAASYIGCSWALITKTTLQHCKITHCIYHSDKEVIQPGPNVHKVDISWTIKEKHFNLSKPDTDPDSIWMYAESSGTTGDPKIIPLTHNEFYKRVMIGQSEFLAFAERMINLYHPLKTMINLYHPLKSTVQYRTPIAILNNVVVDISQQLKDNCLVAGSLRQIKIFLEDYPIPKEPFNSIVSAGGAAVSKKDCEFMLQYFKIVRITYSATEISRICQKEITHIDQYNGSVGAPVEGCVIKFNSENSNILRIFSNKTDNHMGVYTNDTGYMKDGELYITGRVYEILNIDGIKINPVKIDKFIESIEGVKHCMCFNDDGVLSALIVGSENVEILSLCEEEMGISYTPKKFYFVNSLPYNQNGKLLRREAKAYIRA